MAHRDQRGAVRDRGHGARRLARALSGAAVAVALSVPAARAQDWTARPELASSALPDPGAYWGEFGRPGWVADLWLDRDAPWVVAGHARGGFRVDEPLRAPRQLTDPADAGSYTPITWYDSLSIVAGEGAERQGWGGALATAEGVSTGEREKGAVAVIDLRSGDYGWDENSLTIGRRDSSTWLRGEAYGLNRGAAGSMDLAGRHLWGLAGGVRRGLHALDAGYVQQGVAARLIGSEEESTRDRAGFVTYRFASSTARGEVTWARGFAHAESFASYFDPSNRDASSSSLSARAWHRSGVTAGFTWRREQVTRTLTDELEDEARSVWADAAWSRALGAGTLRVGLGAGRHDAFPSWELAPDVSYAVTGGGIAARIGVERVLHAVWSDLAFGQNAFLQRAWAGVGELSIGASRRNWARLTFLGGRTQDRAILTRTPLVEYALRRGIEADPEPYAFGLLSGEARGEWRWLFAEGTAFALSRPTHAVQPRVDPGFGFRAVGGPRFHLFQGQLGVELYVGAEGVGARDSEEGFDRRLAGYATTSLGGLVKFGNALITLRMRNLEDEVHEEPWIDSETGLEALGPGRELRFGLTVVLHE